MSLSRFNATYSGLSSVAKKVYEAVPIAQNWTHQQIIAELHRAGKQIERNVLSGCLNTLIRAGLINEDSKGCFIREEVRQATKPISVNQEPDMPSKNSNTSPSTSASSARVTVPLAGVPTTAAKPTPVLSPLDRFGALAARCAVLAGQIKALASDISDAAVDVQEQMDAGGADAQHIAELEARLVDAEADRQKLRAFQLALGALAA